ncbi:pyridoxal phosphate-dependent aminotransferase [Caproiciproducens faecalis]|uniref:Aminotransferase class I/II-fold pyridoxal phosphate-dependent enzyme n=1 Tax=Caproiciproducens faecalis TaxID=2820301 RepID=A0ABS7DJJ8_9FIRM|nr:histidinol-phosphate transaminase [Caproiciproducens faecalis]MBW7571281.1 aminotransferase class I/II-fold pyridoxal phosphate-dependent enzyme [Caproiciproducens faecalis]
MVHGGDIYRNQVRIDFSVNSNPLGIPDSVKSALHEAVGHCEQYPDIRAQELTDSVSKMTGVEKEHILFGNGASELFLAVIHAVQPKRIVIPVPSFFGYEKAASASNAQIYYYEMQECAGFALNEGILKELTEETDLLFLANPNNPVGNLVDSALLEKVARVCLEKKITVVLDECFLEFTGEEERLSYKNRITDYPNILVVRAFTKIFAIPGVRLGYLFCGDRELKEKIENQLPEWNLSVFAQAAGTAACLEKEYVEKTAGYVKTERECLTAELKRLGIRVHPSAADYLLLNTDLDFYHFLLRKEILVRDCGSYRGLQKGYYRVAVKNHGENEALIRAVEELMREKH